MPNTLLFSPPSEWKLIESDTEWCDTLMHSRHPVGFVYGLPEIVPFEGRRKYEDVTFEKVSFSKVRFSRFTFNRCTFKECLFVGAAFDHCEFHQCTFIASNPHKSVWNDCYIRPSVFDSCIPASSASNVGVHVFQQLLHNYRQMDQLKLAADAEFYFRKWSRHQLLYNISREQKRIIKVKKFFLEWVPDWTWQMVSGYGLRYKRYAAISFAVVFGLAALNYFMWPRYGMQASQTIEASLYVTVSYLTPLGAGGEYSPANGFGQVLIAAESVFGWVWMAVLGSIVVKGMHR